MSDAPETDQIDWDEAARTVLDADALHESRDGIYVDCPECGSPATITNLLEHGRCNGYLDEQIEGIDFEVENKSCSAKLQLELAYTAAPETEQ